MRRTSIRLASAMLIVALVPAQAAPAHKPAVVAAAAANHKAKIEVYQRALHAHERAAAAYWKTISEKRSGRLAKRRAHQPAELADYVLTQPPVYAGPPPPPGYRPSPPTREPAEPKLPIPVIADFLAAALEQFQFVPDRPADDAAFKRAYAKVAIAAGLTREQAVRVYAFETGGNGTYDVQAGLTSPQRKDAHAISPAVGYNQLLSTNTISLLAEHGDRFLSTLRKSAETTSARAHAALDRKLASLHKMIIFSRSVPKVWSEQDKLAKTTRGGIGIHAAVLDRDIGPLLQTQKLLDSVLFARTNGYAQPLTAAELELMNFTGDGNGFDMVTMPQQLRERVPTSNFFQRQGYERNPIARRTGTVAVLFASIETKMDRASQAAGARELAQAF